ncbi:hypothetical protein MNB_SUP05-SYMBIONT-4-1274 [hydrothermal vent metagenome]|uniref:Uncharacterized protein n=1 Tax=hydrothermal vent metagenome TaxID=652676 RepID=A0A1W1DYA1_9ZZZZ
MGVGVFLNARLVDRYRQNISKYQYYLAIVRGIPDKAYIFSTKSTIEKYNKSVNWHYGYAFACFVVLTGILSFAHIFKNGIIGSILLHENFIIRVGFMVIFLFLVGLLLKISHIARGRIEIEDIADMKVSALIKFIEEGKTPEEKNR